MQTSIVDLTVFFAVLIFFRVEKSWSLTARHVVAGPLPCSQIKERVAKSIFFVIAAGGALVVTRGGRAVPWTGRTYDCTKGFQGEDVLQ